MINRALELLGLDNPKDLKEFEVEDTFNSPNRLYGYLCNRGDHRYGALVIFRVNGEACEQVIYGTPKLHYPFDKNGTYQWPDIHEIRIWDKLDGTNVLAYAYWYQNKKYITYKTRLTPVIQDSQFNPFKQMWVECLQENSWIMRLILSNPEYNLSFELFGFRNQITIQYSVPLDVNFLFGVKIWDAEVNPPNMLNLVSGTKLPVGGSYGKAILSSEVLTTMYNNFRESMSIKNIDGLFTEGMVIYAYIGGASWRMYKCLDYRTSVLTRNGWIKLGVIVQNKLRIEVATLLNDGSLGWRFVNGWHKSKLEGREMCRVRLKNSVKTSLGYRGVNSTVDHKWITPEGEIPAGELSNRVVYTGELAPNKKQMEIVIGTLLGDASISKGERRLRFSQTDILYSKLKSKLLDEFVQSEFELDMQKYRESLANNSWQVSTESCIWCSQLREKWYPNGKKMVPKDIELTSLMLAIWYMDDGSLSGGRIATLATMGFSKDEIEFLIKKLSDYGINGCSITTQNVIIFNADGTRELMKKIGSYIIPCMRRKVTKDAPKYNPKVYDIGLGIPGLDIAIVTESTLPKKEKSLYCIDVEDTHNFVTTAGIVHNCKPEEIEKIHWAASGSIPMIALKNTALNTFEDNSDPTVANFETLLLEEYSHELINKSATKIQKAWKWARERMILAKEVNEVWAKANLAGFDIMKDKGSTMKFISQYFPRDKMSKVGTIILIQAGLIEKNKTHK
jgi:hypothetical protein